MEDKNLKANEQQKKLWASLFEFREADIKAQDAEWKQIKQAK